ncbi:tripartite tricarboxylate transporter substrate binding protein [Noviherbaspirillum saxi]|uniref:Tripartite tricarboxylate transporter substrate binding protein n=1 Tax=Noviherbaspirillum saxi TaxID=2320863 RepID=A0A3A3FMR4_9BURK|nr:tripartite tricarboxylate transporter substrate binding protein [Noviherbaspirillum saxi]
MDTIARLLAQRLSTQFGQQVIVDNRPGANGVIGSTSVYRSPADGYTLLIQTSTFLVTPMLLKNVPYTVEKDFTPISNLGSVPMIMTANPNLPYKNLAEFLSAAKTDSSKFTFSTAALGSPGHLAQEAIKRDAKISIPIVPYKGTGPALADVIGGHVSSTIDALPSSLPHIKSGKLKALAVTSAKRIPQMPEVPTVAESGLPGFEVTSWYGLFAPTGLPAPLAQKIQKEVAIAMKSESVSKALTDQGFVIQGSTPEELASHVKAENVKLGRLVKDAKINIE